MTRPAEFRLAKADDVTISARTAALLARAFDIRGAHAAMRGGDIEIAVDLDALLLAAARWRERQTIARTVEHLDNEQLPRELPRQAAGAEVVSEFEVLGTKQVADLLNVTSRAVRLACEAGRLRGRKDARGRWWISRDAAREYQRRGA